MPEDLQNFAAAVFAEYRSHQQQQLPSFLPADVDGCDAEPRCAAAEAADEP